MQHGVDGVLIENMHDTPYSLPQHLGEVRHIYSEIIFMYLHGPIPADITYTSNLLVDFNAVQGTGIADPHHGVAVIIRLFTSMRIRSLSGFSLPCGS